MNWLLDELLISVRGSYSFFGRRDTRIAYRFTVDLLVSKVSYMTRLDEFIFGSTFLVFFSLIQVITTSALMCRGNDVLSLKIDVLSRFLFLILFIFVVIISFSSRG